MKQDKTPANEGQYTSICFVLSLIHETRQSAAKQERYTFACLVLLTTNRNKSLAIVYTSLFEL